MCANVLPQTKSSPLASTGRSLFAKLTSPLRARSRNLADFHISPHEPHRRYSPGDLVKGIVVLTVVKPIRITHLTVSLHGFVRVFKGPNAAAELSNDALLAASTTSRKSQYFGNGQASLFQDEVILCGEGRLEVGVYEFEFDLEFPGKGLPSSVDFERGTITYMIRSTITRPTSIAATSSCDRKVSLIETVDIGPLMPPKPRIISLEPISRKQRKPKPKPKLDAEGTDPAQPSDGQPADDPATEESMNTRDSGDQRPISPRSPGPSDLQSQSEYSGESVVSSSTGMSYQQTSQIGTVPSSTKSGKESLGGTTNGTRPSGCSKTITAKIELLKAGCLPGDSIPLKITIQHTKWIKSMHGIIITLYRQGRIDSAPPPQLFEDVKGKAAERLKHEEYYPKSKTGLGGLSLSSAGSSSVFRKDLSQTLAPIIIDPRTLSTVVTASIRVPEDVFPTIKDVPGEMISFKYHIEVVVDLGGKLAGQDRHLPRLGMMSLPSMTNPNGQITHASSSNGMLSAWGGNIVNTDSIRREKSVVACLFEITVGTVDSSRIRGRGNTFIKPGVEDVPESPRSPGFASQQQDTQPDQMTSTIYEEPPYPYQNEEQHYGPQGNQYDYYDHQEGYPPTADAPHYLHPSVPPPEIVHEEGLTDKERMRRAEQQLLPSQPPEEDEPSSSRSMVATAPEDEDDLYSPDDTGPSVEANTIRPTMSSLSNVRHDRIQHAPSAPTLEDLTPGVSGAPGDDKQELERQRLMAEASSPADFPTEDDNAGEGSSGAQQEPTAPVLTEADEYGGHYTHHAALGPSRQHESLPRYER